MSKFILFLFIFYWSNAWAEFAKKREVDHDPIRYKGQSANIIQWNKLDVDKWFDIKRWMRERKLKNENPLWKIQSRGRLYQELMGRFISCVGSCQVYRGEKFAMASHQTQVLERDEVRTLDDSYAWIYLSDGSLVRLSPRSSLSFNEINFGKKRNMLVMRVNEGNILFIGRQNHPLAEFEGQETDSIFLPLYLKEANISYYVYDRFWGLNEEDLLASALDDRTPFKDHFKKANAFWRTNQENSHFKPTVTMLVLPNITLEGVNPIIGAYVTPGEDSYFKNYNPTRYYDIPEEEQNERPLTLYFRGYDNNRTEIEAAFDIWFQVDSQGKDFSSKEVNTVGLGDVVTRRIPSIFIAREFWFSRYGLPLSQENLDPKELATEQGYRLWETESVNEQGKLDLDARLDFWRVYSRKAETMNVYDMKRFKEHREFLRPSLDSFSVSFFNKAAEAYLNSLKQDVFTSWEDQKTIHEYGYDFWLYHKAKGN